MLNCSIAALVFTALVQLGEDSGSSWVPQNEIATVLKQAASHS
jgi:hypothetical protein